MTKYKYTTKLYTPYYVQVKQFASDYQENTKQQACLILTTLIRSGHGQLNIIKFATSEKLLARRLEFPSNMQLVKVITTLPIQKTNSHQMQHRKH